PGAPLDELFAHPRWGRYCHVESVPRPLIRAADVDKVKGFWKRRRPEFNRLKRMGPVTLERLNGPEQLQPIFDELIDYYDCRMGALKGRPPFRNDPRKKDFFLALMREPGLMHATIMRAGNTLVAADIGFSARDGKALGVFCYSPFLAKCSPGKIYLF